MSAAEGFLAKQLQVAKLVLSYLSVSMENRNSHLRDFRQILYLLVSLTSVDT